MKTYPHEDAAELTAAGIDRIPRPPQDVIRCNHSFCDQTAPTLDEAIEAGWLPGYWDGDAEAEGPICPDCCRVYLRAGADGEMESYDRFAEATA